MRKPLIVSTLVAATLFGTGYVIGQIRGVTPSSAAGTAQGQPQTGAPTAPDPNRLGPHAAGQVTEVNNNTLTIKPVVTWPGTGSVTRIDLTSTTQYIAGHDKGINNTVTKDSIKVGSFVVAMGALSSDGTSLTATRVMVLPTAPVKIGLGHFGPRAAGQVTDVKDNTITIKPGAAWPGSGSVTTITLTPTTEYVAGRRQGTNGSVTKNSITVGTYIMAMGTVSADGKSLTAQRVFVLPSAPTWTPNRGSPHIFWSGTNA